jgi:hypothetical protein
MNTYGSVVVRANICFVTGSQKMEKNIILSNVKEWSFVSSWGRTLLIPMKGSRKHLVMILYHMLKYSGGTKTSQIGEKWWKINRDDGRPILS